MFETTMHLLYQFFYYCDVAWMPMTAVLSKRLEHFHSHILQGLSDCSSFVKLTLMERHRFHTAVQVFKILHLLCPRYLRD